MVMVMIVVVVVIKMDEQSRNDTIIFCVYSDMYVSGVLSSADVAKDKPGSIGSVWMYVGIMCVFHP